MGHNCGLKRVLNANVEDGQCMTFDHWWTTYKGWKDMPTKRKRAQLSKKQLITITVSITINYQSVLILHYFINPPQQNLFIFTNFLIQKLNWLFLYRSLMNILRFFSCMSSWNITVNFILAVNFLQRGLEKNESKIPVWKKRLSLTAMVRRFQRYAFFICTLHEMLK